MTSTFLSPPLPVSVYRRPIAASSGSRPPTAPPAAGAQRPWWSPLFRTVFRDGSDDPAANSTGEAEDQRVAAAAAARRTGRLTAEKARALRREMRANETWHDAMYHSSIASRLASPESDLH